MTTAINGTAPTLSSPAAPEPATSCNCPPFPAMISGLMANDILDHGWPFTGQSNQQLAEFILDRLNRAYPMHTFVVAITNNTPPAADCFHNGIWLMDENVQKYGVHDKCLNIATAFGGDDGFAQTIDCYSDNGEMGEMFESCTPDALAMGIALAMYNQCKQALNLFGVVDDGLDFGLASSMPSTVFGHRLHKCPPGGNGTAANNSAGRQWHTFGVVKQNYFRAAELFYQRNQSYKQTEMKQMIKLSRPVFIALICLLLFLLFFISATITFLCKMPDNFHNGGGGIIMHLRAHCFFLVPAFGKIGERALDSTLVDTEQLIYSGPLSRVYFGHYRHSRTEAATAVAIKVPLMEAFQSSVIERELGINSGLKHHRIVEYVGFYRDAYGDIRIVSEFMAGGNLHAHLSNRKNTLTVGHLFNFLQQIAEGMEYLASKLIVHRDLATRNCMLDQNYSAIKIADFGLSRQLLMADPNYSCANPLCLPERWIAIECFGEDGIILPHCKFSEKTDIWAFGMVFWECFSRGAMPYQSEEFNVVIMRLKGGWRMECPEQCPPMFYEELVAKCWAPLPEERPTFGELRKQLDATFDAMARENPDEIGREV